MKEWNEYREIISEVEDFQQKMAALNNRSKKRLLTKGRQSNTSPYTIKPSLARSKSAPPGFGAVGESEVDIVPQIQDDLNRDIWSEDDKHAVGVLARLIRNHRSSLCI